MKVAVLLFAFVAAASAQTEPWCRCAVFTTYDWVEKMVWEGHEIAIDSCEEVRDCKNHCATQLNLMSDYGNLWSLTDSGITVGQHICDSLIGLHHHFVHNHYVYGYYEVCGGAWQYTGIESEQMLCCDHGKHVHCISESLENSVEEEFSWEE